MELLLTLETTQGGPIHLGSFASILCQPMTIPRSLVLAALWCFTIDPVSG
jgi:hypothetical protein